MEYIHPWLYQQVLQEDRREVPRLTLPIQTTVAILLLVLLIPTKLQAQVRPPPPPLPPPTDLQAQVLTAIGNEPKEDTTASEEAGNPSKKPETSDSSRRRRKDSVSSVVPPSLSKDKFKAFKTRTETAFKEGTQAAARAGAAIKDFTGTKGAALKVHTEDALKKCKKGLDGNPLKDLKTKATIKFSKLKGQAGSRSKSEKDEKHSSNESINLEESSARRKSSSVSMQSQEMPSDTSSGSCLLIRSFHQ